MIVMKEVLNERYDFAVSNENIMPPIKHATYKKWVANFFQMSAFDSIIFLQEAIENFVFPDKIYTK